MMKNNQKGQSLFEVVVALGLMTMIIVTMVAMATKALSSATASKNQTQANRYAQEGIEWLRGERDAGYDLFYPKITGVSTRCMSNAVASFWTRTDSECGPTDFILDSDGLPTSFKREVTKGIEGANSVKVEVAVEWSDGNGTHVTRLDTELADWRAQ